MPVLVDEATFDRAQRRFAENKRKGSQRAHGMDDAEAPRYWLTGKLYCGECGSTMQGVSGTSKTGRKYYYYYCSAQRRKECHLHKARKRDLEDMVLFALHNIVDDEENVTALALDAAEYYEKSHDDTAYLEALEAKRREVEKSLANLVKVIEKGVVSDTVTKRLTQLEEQKSALNDAIETENVRVSLCEDKHSIQAYFDKFLHADVNDPEIRDQVFEYFVDKVYLYDDKLVVSMWFSEDDRQEITWRDWFSLDEYWTDESPFVKGGGVEFDCFPLGSTIVNVKAFGIPKAFFHAKAPRTTNLTYANKKLHNLFPMSVHSLLDKLNYQCSSLIHLGFRNVSNHRLHPNNLHQREQHPKTIPLSTLNERYVVHHKPNQFH